MESNFEIVSKLVKGSRWGRFIHHPLRYISAMLMKRVRNYNAIKTVYTFWGRRINIHLPSSLDIYLTGAKSHSSEMRLSSFLFKRIDTCTAFLDIGAHVGYFSLLMNDFGKEGFPVYAIEAAPSTFQLLHQNVNDCMNIFPHQLAASEQTGVLQFLELPPKYAEYNSLNVHQYEGEEWFKKLKPSIKNVHAICIDDFIQSLADKAKPNLIKIDVEGAELAVLKGMKHFIATMNPTLIVEFVCKAENENQFEQIEQLLAANNFKAHFIDVAGELILLPTDIYSWMQENQLDSENIVFVKN